MDGVVSPLQSPLERLEDLSELSVLKLPEHIRGQYPRLALISHPRHLENVKHDDSTLIVTTDWLQWRQCVSENRHCIHFEWALAERINPEIKEGELYLHYNDWAKVDGVDVTEFHGVSLATLFWREVTLACRAYDRLSHALDRICLHFGPSEIILYDLRSDYDLLDPHIRRDLVRETADRHGAVLVDRHDPAAPETTLYGVRIEEPQLREFLRGCYAMAVGAAFGLLWRLRSGKPKVFLFNNAAVMDALLEKSRDAAVAPVILAEQWPKSLRFLRSCRQNGVVLAELPRASLTGADKAALRAMTQKLFKSWSAPASGLEKARRAFIKERCIDSGLLRDRAARVKRYNAFMKRHQFRRVMVGDITNTECRIIAETARVHNAPFDELLNGMFLTDRQNDARIARGGNNRLLARGAVDERWAQKSAFGLKRLRAGYPPDGAWRQKPETMPPRQNNWLIMPCYTDGDDSRGLMSNMFSTLVDVVRTLTDLGYKNIRIKLHPGMPKQKAYFEKILTFHKLNYPVFQDGGLIDHIYWADFVAGPIGSGALLETLGAGRSYFAFRPWPTGINPAYFENTPIMSSVADLRRALKSGMKPDATAILQDFCSMDDIPDSVGCVWKALAESNEAA